MQPNFCRLASAQTSAATLFQRSLQNALQSTLQSPLQNPSARYFSGLQTPFRPTSSALFSGLHVRLDSRPAAALGVRFSPLGAHPRAFSFAASGEPAKAASIIQAVSAGLAQLIFFDKPVIDQTSSLKDGRQVQVRRLQANDAELICNYHTHAGQWSMFGHLALLESRVNHLCILALNAANLGSDTLVAIVDGNIVGISEYQKNTCVIEPPIDRLLLSSAGLGLSEVCVAKTMVVLQDRNCGIGTALKRGQMNSARQAGYKAIASRSNHPAVLRIVRNMGGEIINPALSMVWSLIPLQLCAAPPAGVDLMEG